MRYLRLRFLCWFFDVCFKHAEKKTYHPGGCLTCNAPGTRAASIKPGYILKTCRTHHLTFRERLIALFTGEYLSWRE